MNATAEKTVEQTARERVAGSEALNAHSETIWNDWANMDDHMEWIATAPESEIIAWAETIESDVE